MALSYRARRRWSLVILLVGMPTYIVVAVTLVGLMERPSVPVELMIYAGLGVLWALVRGKKPVPPVLVGRFHRFTTERVWPGTAARRTTDASADVVDVEVREVNTPRVSTDGRPPKDTD